MATTDRRKTGVATGSAGRRESIREAIERLSAKRVAPAYRGPRGNQELDRGLTDHSVDRLELLVR